LEAAMRKTNFLLVTFLLILILLSCNKTEEQKLCGTWHMCSGSYNGADFSINVQEDIRISYKILSEDHFTNFEVFVNNPDSIIFAAIGTYEFKDSIYVEHYKASNIPNKENETARYHSILKDGNWILTLFKEDLSVEETWCRIEKLPAD
jgi:hypothetical protein